MAEEHKKGLNADLVWNDLMNCAEAKVSADSVRRRSARLVMPNNVSVIIRRNRKRKFRKVRKMFRRQILKYLMRLNWKLRSHIF